MVRSLVLAALLLLPNLATADDGAALATRVAQACGVDAWSNVETVSFTWTHHPSGSERSYVWTPKTDRVSMTYRDETVEIVTNAIEDEDQRRAHSAFVNDHYWMLFELRLAWDDGVAFTDLGSRTIPDFEDRGEYHALEVRYTGEGGYTPGDSYVLYLDEDDRPVAWAFHREGAEKPSLVTTREEWSEAGGLRFPTRFVTAEGEAFISITDVTVERSGS